MIVRNYSAVERGLYMKVPKEIKDSIRKSAKAFHTAREHEKIVRGWLDEQGLENDTVHDSWIDTIEMGSGNSKDFIEFLKRVDE
ncbi:hypothetical protein A499_18214 [Niallia nealsonii AAU1]|nr:hypothetical protein A499_18214 [Niallia nealsonii AAU1]